MVNTHKITNLSLHSQLNGFTLINRSIEFVEICKQKRYLSNVDLNDLIVLFQNLQKQNT
ncbi:MAG: Uncharacterised protein [Formosa sp. Hel1_33_131]|nr:MAG: Uncharacterised protein [Formosa sp. Hel1_33_131]